MRISEEIENSKYCEIQNISRRNMMTDIREKLKKANGVTEDKKPNDKIRIAQLEQENAELMDAVIELAEIIAGGE